MGNSIFQRGYSASRKEKERQDRERENLDKKLWRFFLSGDGEEAEVRFLTEEPVNFYEHSVKEGQYFNSYTCLGKDCPYCGDGDRATYKGAYLVVDRREYEYTDSSGKKQTGKNQVKLFVQGMKVVSQLDRISERYGLSNREVTIVRLGKGTQTTYTIERGDEDKLSVKEIKNLLPEKLRKDYDGTMESLMTIVEKQLLMNTSKSIDDEDGGSSDETIIGVEDGEEEEETSKKMKKKKKSIFKKPQHCIKPRVIYFD